MPAVMPAARDEQALRRHYEVERELANRLRSASAGDRLHLYGAVYDELFRRVPDHPQLSRKQDAAEQQEATRRQLNLLGRFLRPGYTYLEIGAGDCHLARTVAAEVGHAYGVDVSDQVADGRSAPPNFTLILSDGIHLNVPDASID